MTTTHANTDGPMTMHVNEDDLVLHYYGEMSEGDEARTSTHLAECVDCHAAYRRLQRVLAAVDEAALVGPDLTDSFERVVWARLEADLPADRRGWFTWLVLSPGRLAWAAAVVLLVTGAFFAGRMMPRVQERTASPSSADAAAQVREGILLVDLGDHLDRTQMVLVELVSGDYERGGDIAGERARAEQLVTANRLYRQTAAAAGDARLVDLLDELERALVDVSAGPEYLSARDLENVRRRIESRGLVFKVRVLSSEVRQRQRMAMQARTGGQRSSL